MSVEDKLEVYLAELQGEVVKCNKQINDLSYDDICCRANHNEIAVVDERKTVLKSVIRTINKILDNNT